MSQLGFTLSRTALKPGFTPANAYDALWLQPLDGLIAAVPFTLAGGTARFAALHGDTRIGSISFAAGGSVSGQPVVTLDWNAAGDAAVLALATAWNSIKNLAVTEFAGQRLELRNWVDLHVALATDGPLTVVAEAAKRGQILLSGTGPHTVVVGVESNVQDWTNHFRIATGGGDDDVTIRQTALEAVRGIYLGQWTTTDISTGGGDDIIRGWGSNDTVDGGLGQDVFVLRGVEAGYSFTTVGDVTTVRDINLADGNDGIDRVRDVEVIRFASGPDKLRGGPPANTAPDAVDGTAATAEDSSIAFSLASLVTDAQNNVVSYALGTIIGGTVTGFNASAGTGSFVPTANFNGPASIGFTATDAGGLSDSATLSITVTPVNDAPVAIDGTTTGAEDTIITGQLQATDIDSANLLFGFAPGTVQVGGPLVLNADGSFVFTAPADFNGTYTINFQVSDGSLTDTGTHVITVTPVNDAPVAAGGAFDVREGDLVGGNLGGFDVDGDALTFSLVGPAPAGVTVLANGQYSIDVAPDFNGTVDFTFQVTDGSLTSQATQSVTYLPANDAPVAANDSFTTAFNTTLVIAGPGVLANDSDIDSADLDALLESGATNGQLVLDDATGAFAYTPNAGFRGTDSFTYRASDGDLTSNLATVSITVEAGPPATLVLDASGRAFITGSGGSAPFLLVTTPEGPAPNFHPNTTLHQGILEAEPGSPWGGHGVWASAAPATWAARRTSMAATTPTWSMPPLARCACSTRPPASARSAPARRSATPAKASSWCAPRARTFRC
jgi:hypothetical protein